jgi:aminopeptidase N
MQKAFRLDSLRGSHPIEVPVKDALDVEQIFDAISYLKGSSVIRMLATHMELKAFLEGVSKYLKDHAYGNATTKDLWAALSPILGQDVNALMDPWIRKIGYPVLTVAKEPGQIRIKQSRYLSTGDVKPEDDQTLWWIPLGLKGKVDLEERTAMSLAVKEDTIRGINDAFYKINTSNTGFYRTNYPLVQLASFGNQIDQLTISDKIGLIGDVGALALSGDATTPALLGFLEGFSVEENQFVWSQITSSLAIIKSIFSEEEDIAKALEAFTVRLIEEAVKRVGWEHCPEEDYLTGQLRVLLISSAGHNGNMG